MNQIFDITLLKHARRECHEQCAPGTESSRRRSNGFTAIAVIALGLVTAIAVSAVSMLAIDWSTV